MPQLFSSLEELLPPPLAMTFEDSDSLPHPRISISTSPGQMPSLVEDPLETADSYHLATMKRNDRITAMDWFQDVRHIELDLHDDVLYVFSPHHYGLCLIGYLLGMHQVTWPLYTLSYQLQTSSHSLRVWAG